MAVTICFIGIDGSGKTTQAKILLKYLKKKNIDVSYLHYDHIFLKIPNSLSKKGLLAAKDKKDQSIGLIKYLKKLKIISLILPIIIYIDFIMFYTLKVKLKSGVIILDRYLYDKLAKFHDLGILEFRLLKPIIRITPKPDRLFYFNITPKNSFLRKKELTIEVLQKREMMLTSIAGQIGAIEIDANNSIESITKEILNNLSEYA